jgi:hypothetical protein
MHRIGRSPWIRWLAGCAALLSAAVQAGDARTEWRLLGPAFSHHFAAQAPIVRWEQDPGGLCAPAADAPAAPAATAPSCTPGWRRIERGWRSTNPALGLQWSRDHGTHQDRVLATLVQDSYSQSSYMLAGGRLWPLGHAGSLRLRGGVIGGLWHRSVLPMDQVRPVKKTVPLVLPAFSLEERTTGLGINASLAPRLSIGGNQVTSTTTLMVQATWALP